MAKLDYLIYSQEELVWFVESPSSILEEAQNNNIM